MYYVRIQVKELERVAKALGCTPAQLAIAWYVCKMLEDFSHQLLFDRCVRNPRVSSVLFGATSKEQVQENVAAMHYVDQLTPEIMSHIDSIFEPPQQPCVDSLLQR